MSERLKNLIAGLVLIGLFYINRFLELDTNLIVRFVMLFGVLFHSLILGRRFAPRSGGFSQIFLGGISFLAILSLGMTGWFYAGLPMGEASDFWMLLGTMIAVQILNFLIPETLEGEPVLSKEKWSPRRALRLAAVFIPSLTALAYVLIGAYRGSTGDSIRTPWPLLPSLTLAAIALIWLMIPLTAWLVRSRAVTAIQSGLALFSTTAVVPLLYRLGFGFDGFLHLAGEKQILLTGTLNPKPLYYIGQYVLTTWMSRTTDVSIDTIDRWLVPVIIACILPLALYLVRFATDENEPSSVAPFALLLLPLSAFVATTPQAFAYALGFMALLMALDAHKDIHPIAPLLIGAWAIAVHPLAGIPFVLITLAILLRKAKNPPWLRIVSISGSWFFVALSAVAIPVVFYFLSLKGTVINWNIGSLFSTTPWSDLFSSLKPWIGNTYVLWPAWASLIRQALPVLGFAAAIGSIRLAPKEQRTPYILLVTAAVLLLLSGMILKTAGDFAFLIDYERGNYAERLSFIAMLCLVAAGIPSIQHLVRLARERATIFSVVVLAGGCLIAAAQSYNALPRHDALVTGRGWSVGAADVEAVKTIDQDAEKQAYTVLSNQSVSAAAVSQFGFRRYHDDVFYYPIPTGGPLYETYLNMTYKEPSRDTAKTAATLGGSDLVYVVLNDYWWNASHVGESLTAISDKNWTLGQTDKGTGKSVRVYKFDFRTSAKR